MAFSQLMVVVLLAAVGFDFGLGVPATTSTSSTSPQSWYGWNNPGYNYGWGYPGGWGHNFGGVYPWGNGYNNVGWGLPYGYQNGPTVTKSTVTTGGSSNYLGLPQVSTSHTTHHAPMYAPVRAVTTNTVTNHGPYNFGGAYPWGNGYNNVGWGFPYGYQNGPTVSKSTVTTGGPSNYLGLPQVSTSHTTHHAPRYAPVRAVTTNTVTNHGPYGAYYGGLQYGYPRMY